MIIKLPYNFIKFRNILIKLYLIDNISIKNQISILNSPILIQKIRLAEVLQIKISLADILLTRAFVAMVHLIFLASLIFLTPIKQDCKNLKGIQNQLVLYFYQIYLF